MDMTDEEYEKAIEEIVASGRVLEAIKTISKALKELPSDEAEDRHYIKIYADDEPSVKAEKLYQICGETQNREVAEWLKEYFPSTDDNWIPVKKHGTPHNEGLYIVTLRNWYGAGRCAFYDDVEILPYGREGWDKATAWMPSPEPYREENEE